jgi:hypothetical protein
MARRINIGQIGSFCEGQMNQLMRVVVLETDAELKSQSPVDTGRFQRKLGNWRKCNRQLRRRATANRGIAGDIANRHQLQHQALSVSAIHTTFTTHLPYAERTWQNGPQ